jgi:small conductance mechanosensitive channel
MKLPFSISTLEKFFTPIIIIFVAYIVGRILSFLLKRYIRKSARLLKTDPTNYSFLQHAVSLFVFVLAVMFIFYYIPGLRSIGTTLFAGAGILAAIIGFASQEAFSNIISGIFLVIFKPFSVGDQIKLLSINQVGIVEDITLRHTVLKSLENRRIVIPNSVISREAILNSTLKDERISTHIEITIAYESSIDKALQVMKDEVTKHPSFLDIRTRPEKEGGVEAVVAKVVALQEGGIRLRAYAWAQNDADAFEMKCDLFKTIKEGLDREGVQLAQVQRVLPVTK